jgi:hypothetical protein
MVNITKPQRAVLLEAFKNDTRSVKAIEELYNSFEEVPTDDDIKIFSFMVS